MNQPRPDRELIDGPWWLITLLRVDCGAATHHTTVTQEHPVAFLMRTNKVFKKLGDPVQHYLLYSTQVPEGLVDETITAFPEY